MREKREEILLVFSLLSFFSKASLQFSVGRREGGIVVGRTYSALSVCTCDGVWPQL